MKNQPVFFSLTIDNDILWRYALPESVDPAVLVIPSISEHVVASGTDIFIEVHQNGAYFRYHLKYKATEPDSKFIFDVTDREILDSRSITVEYKEKVRFEFVKELELPSYVNKTNLFNMTERNSYSKISSLVSAVDSENKPLVKFMLELNNKMDTILHLMSQSSEKYDIEAICCGINQLRFIVYSKDDIADGTHAYTKNIIGDIDSRFRFATVVKFTKIKQTPDGAFYGAEFIGLQNEIVDQLIRFIFNSERELIKDARYYNENR